MLPQLHDRQQAMSVGEQGVCVLALPPVLPHPCPLPWAPSGQEEGVHSGSPPRVGEGLGEGVGGGAWRENAYALNEGTRRVDRGMYHRYTSPQVSPNGHPPYLTYRVPRGATAGGPGLLQ